MPRFAVGQPVPRTEDPRLLTGGGRYVDDLKIPGMVHGCVVRSPYAHARIRGIDGRAAKQMPGVLAVLTAEDWAARGHGTLPPAMLLKARDGKPMWAPAQTPLAREAARYVGEPVALVVAETPAAARDAAEAVAVAYEPLAALTDTARALDADAPLVWPERPGNECFFHELGDAAAVEAAFARAARVVERRFVIPRIAAATIEPRGCIGVYDAFEDRYTIHTGFQHAHRVRSQLAEALGTTEERVRVAPVDIGGSFGMRGSTYPEQALVLWAARETGRPVKWLSDRGEALMSDHQARDNVTEAALALDAEGHFLALRVRTVAALGAYVATNGAGPPTLNLGTLALVYKTPAIHVQVSAVFTNTVPTAPYRGAGRPEAAYVMETMIEAAARATGIDRIALRRRNTIPPEAMPFKTGLTFTYDCGEFEANLDAALILADHAGYGARKAASERAGRLRGLGVSNTAERAGAPSFERANICFEPSGALTLRVGSISHGQGHETIYKQLLCERLGVAPEAVRVIEADTDQMPTGGGTFGSRTAIMSGTAIGLAADKAVDKGKRIAAHLLEASDADIAFEAGTFRVVGTDRTTTLAEVAAAAHNPARLPPELEPGIDETAFFNTDSMTFPNGVHVCELEIDPETGGVAIDRYAVVDDVGTVLNPLLLKGQIQGGVAQGVGQALMEAVVHDPESGQLLSGSFMDYAMPRADDLSAIAVESRPVPTRTNPLGVKGAGEAGTVGCLPAVMNALADALHPLGAGPVPLPATPERLWRLIQGAQA